MGYTNDPEVLIQRLEEVGLMELIDMAENGRISEPIIVRATSTKEIERIKFLIYSAFRLKGITRAFKIGYESPLEICVRPNQSKKAVGKKAQMHSKLEIIQRSRVEAKVELDKILQAEAAGIVEENYTDPMSLVSMSDDELLRDYKEPEGE